MAFDFSLSPRVIDWRGRLREFVDGTVIPQEQAIFTCGLDDKVRRELQRAAKAAGLWAPLADTALGGGGFRFDEAAVLLEEAGRSLFGPLAINSAAPDEGNMHLLAKVATDAQRQRFLGPLVNGDLRSCFAMTEPAPGAGSDPSALLTTAVQTPRGWSLSGTKHLITGADGADFAIVMARTGESGATMFLVDLTDSGVSVTSHIRTIDSTMVGGHCVLEFDDVNVGDDAVLSAIGEGFRYAQVRLAPARLTHCMRWLGAARRAHEVALERSAQRTLFGQPMGGLGMAQAMIADNEIDLAASQTLLWRTCWHIAEGDRGIEASSRAKVFISEATARIVDRAVQLCGGLGTSEELVVGRIYADIRGFRIYDGASEVHRMSIAKRAMSRVHSTAR